MLEQAYSFSLLAMKAIPGIALLVSGSVMMALGPQPAPPRDPSDDVPEANRIGSRPASRITEGLARVPLTDEQGYFEIDQLIRRDGFIAVVTRARTQRNIQRADRDADYWQERDTDMGPGREFPNPLILGNRAVSYLRKMADADPSTSSAVIAAVVVLDNDIGYMEHVSKIEESCRERDLDAMIDFVAKDERFYNKACIEAATRLYQAIAPTATVLGRDLAARTTSSGKRRGIPLALFGVLWFAAIWMIGL